MSVSAKEVARQKGVIVIVGGFKKMFPQHWDDPRCCFIDSQHADRANIPVNAKAVVFTKALSHSAFFKLQKQAKVIGVDVIHCQNTGELKRTLDQLFIRFESELAGTSPKVVKINEVNPQPPSKDIGVTRARWPKRSTSPMANLVEQTKIAAWAEFVDDARYF